MEKDVSASLLDFVLGENDSVAVRRDMQDIGDPNNPRSLHIAHQV